MQKSSAVILAGLVFILTFHVSPCRGQKQLGLGAGLEIRKNRTLSQHELFYRHPLTPATSSASGRSFTTAMEAATALIYEADRKRLTTVRFSLMPQIFLRKGEKVNLFAGLGVGIMAGETELPGQDLGGPFFFSSKLGFQLVFGDGWYAEYALYHQSNANMYDSNASLNMVNFTITFRL